MVSKDAWLAIVNPAAGGARAADRWPLVARALTGSGVMFDTVHTTTRGAGRALAETAVRAGRRRLLVVGGDGSANDVVNGVMCAGDDPAAPVTLAPVPVGTGNDWARSLGMPRDAAGIARVIAAESSFLHDVGQLDFARPSAEHPARHWFINLAGAGFDSHVIERLPAQVPSPFAYLRGALAELKRYRPPRFRITTDEGSLDERLLLAFVANGRYAGNRMFIAPQARLDDGQLDVIAIRNVGLLNGAAEAAETLSRHAAGRSRRVAGPQRAHPDRDGRRSRRAGGRPAGRLHARGDQRIAAPAARGLQRGRPFDINRPLRTIEGSRAGGSHDPVNVLSRRSNHDSQ